MVVIFVFLLVLYFIFLPFDILRMEKGYFYTILIVSIGNEGVVVLIYVKLILISLFFV